jgi:hypothetical protein
MNDDEDVIKSSASAHKEEKKEQELPHRRHQVD